MYLLIGAVIVLIVLYLIFYDTKPKAPQTRGVYRNKVTNYPNKFPNNAPNPYVNIDKYVSKYANPYENAYSNKSLNPYSELYTEQYLGFRSGLTDQQKVKYMNEINHDKASFSANSYLSNKKKYPLLDPVTYEDARMELMSSGKVSKTFA
jgi:hypothetical protein